MAQTLGFLGIANSITGLIVVHTVYGISFTTLFFRNYYVSVPQELVRAATMDGAGFFRIFWHIMLPLSLPIIVVSVIWQFTQVWNEFLFGASFTSGGSQPVTVALNNLINSTTSVKQYNVDMAAALIAAARPLLFTSLLDVSSCADSRWRGQRLEAYFHMATISIEHASKSYGSTPVLNDISIDVKDGEFLVLLGSSGCGKSTLLNIIAGLEPITEGTIRLDGEVVNDVHPKKTVISPWCSKAMRFTPT